MWCNLKENTKSQLEAIARHCNAQKLTISCAESCTGGGLAFYLTDLPGASAWFEQSFVTYANSAKEILVGVPEVTLEEHGAVSKQTVKAMAQGLVSRYGCDLGIGISGIAGPSGGTPHKPVGLVWFGLCYRGKLITDSQVFAGGRSEVRMAAIEHAITLIANTLIT